MDIVTSLVTNIVEYTVVVVGRQIGYVVFYKSNIDNLKNQVRQLEEAKVEVEQSVDAAHRNGEEIIGSVQSWLKTVDDILAESKGFHDNVGCSNIFLKHKLSRKAKKLTPTISEILKNKKLEGISYRPVTPQALPPSTRDYMTLGSRALILDEIKHALKESNVYKIGVYGMPGVGKTTLTKELEWQVQQDPSFGVVVVATVTKSPDVKKIQGVIADALGLKFDVETEVGRAHRLRERIKKEKKILVILDDIWKKLDLTEVGIPFGDDHKGCKLLLTSRNLDVLTSEMGTQNEFRLEVLSEEESWSLFEKMAGDVVNDINLRPTVLKVAKSCGDLPLLIVTVANALKDKQELYVWKDSLQQLTRFDPEGLRSTVYSAIELSYTFLKTEELKSFFVFIGSFAVAISTQDLLIYGWSLGLYKGVDTLTDARNRVYKLIDDLRASCLLLEGKKDWVQMHDLIYDQASFIASTKKPFYNLKELEELKEWPDMDSLKSHRAIFLHWGYIKKLPERLDCPELEILELNSKDNYLKVPENFLDGVRELKVLDFEGLDFCPSLPLSLCHLTNLRALYLCQCMLDDITIVAKLTHLEILRLDNSEIKELPVEIGQLTHLRLLNLTSCSGLRIIPANLISSLTLLEELYIGNCFIEWEDEGSKHQSNKACLGELRNLHKLRVLNLHIQDVSVLPRDMLIFEKLESYKILIGDGWKWSWTNYVENYEISRTLKLNVGTITNIHLDCGIKRLVNSAEELYLANFNSVKNVLYLLNGEGSRQLKHLHIQNNDEMQCIFDSTEWIHSLQAFPNLESMVLHNLINMEKIFHGPLPVQSFTKLKVIKVVGCDRLKNILFYATVRNLSQLIEFEISQCKCVTEIIVEDDKEIDKIELPRLRSLTLDCLPLLVSFYAKPLNYDIQLGYCIPDRKTDLFIPMALFDEKIVLSNMESLKLSSINLKNIWDDQLSAPSYIESLTSLTIDNCDSLRHLFSSTMARGLVKLQYLKITRCKMLEEIFVSEGKMDNISSATEIVSSDEATFPNLDTLVISQMDSLKSIWKNEITPNSFCKLANLEITSCNQLLKALPSYVINYLLNLETILVTDCDELEVVFEIQEMDTTNARQGRVAINLRTLTLESLPMLRQIWSKDPRESFKFSCLCKLEVADCEILHHIFPFSVTKELLQLELLHIASCGVETIVAKDEMVEETSPTFLFPQLTSLTLWSLANLRSFYPEIHTLTCRVLKTLDVFHCDQLQVFKSKTQEHVPIDQQPLLSIEKVISNIEELVLSSKNVMMICNGQLDGANHIYTIKALSLHCFHEESEKFPSDFLEKFNNLEKLTIICSSFVEIFSSESLDSEYTQTFVKLTHLELYSLGNLEYLCKEKSKMQQILHNLDTLKVYSCDGLKNIAPSWVLFQNLDTLHVMECSGLVNLISSSTATSLLKLKELVVKDCKMIKEIVSSQEEDASDQIITFMKLEHLQLESLSRLTCFCKEKYSFKFPLLKVLWVIECPMMETFSQGMLSTPMLRAVKVTDEGDVQQWEGDLNTTITKIFREKNSERHLGSSSISED